MGDQERLFQWRAADPGGASQNPCPRTFDWPPGWGGPVPHRSGGAGHRGGADHRRPHAALPGRAVRSSRPRRLAEATAFALITGAREDLAPLVLTGPAFTRPDGLPSAAYPRGPPRLLEGRSDPEPPRSGHWSRTRRRRTGASPCRRPCCCRSRGGRRGELQPGPGRRARSPPAPTTRSPTARMIRSLRQPRRPRPGLPRPPPCWAIRVESPTFHRVSYRPPSPFSVRRLRSPR